MKLSSSPENESALDARRERERERERERARFLSPMGGSSRGRDMVARQPSACLSLASLDWGTAPHAAACASPRNALGWHLQGHVSLRRAGAARGGAQSACSAAHTSTRALATLHVAGSR